MVTRKDVAEYAGVSKTTVSRVLNNNGYVSPENRKMVEKAIKELGYRPNLIARSLKTKETRQFLFLAPELDNPFYIEVYNGMEDYAQKRGYTIVVSKHFDTDIVQQRQFDGIILSHASDKSVQDLKVLDIPAVVTNYTNNPLDIPSVGIDIEEGALKAAEYLIKQGHRNIAFLTNALPDGDHRYNGYICALKQAGIALQPKYVMTENGSSAYESGYKAGLGLIKNNMKATAIFTFNDAMAIGAMSAFFRKGYRIPEDISFIGFDDILQSQFTCPPLTTIHMPKYEQGQECARMLLKLIEGGPVESVVLKTRLVERESVAKL